RYGGGFHEAVFESEGADARIDVDLLDLVLVGCSIALRQRFRTHDTEGGIQRVAVQRVGGLHRDDFLIDVVPTATAGNDRHAVDRVGEGEAVFFERLLPVERQLIEDVFNAHPEDIGAQTEAHVDRLEALELHAAGGDLERPYLVRVGPVRQRIAREIGAVEGDR